MTGYILRHEAHFRAVMEEQLRLESSEQIRIRRKRLERNENRIAELKRLFIRIYEDNACGRLSDERFDIMEIRAGLEPVIAAVKGLCPNHLDERTVWQGEVLPAY